LCQISKYFFFQLVANDFAGYNKNDFHDFYEGIYFYANYLNGKLNGKMHEMDFYYLPFEVEYILLGIPRGKVLTSENEQFSDAYGDLQCDYRVGKIDYNTFINQVKSFMFEEEENNQ
jgi:hypothetical protein